MDSGTKMIVDDLKVLLIELKHQFKNECAVIKQEKYLNGAKEYVLKTDFFSQKRLIEMASIYHPESIVISEELNNYHGIDQHKGSMVVIDPLDGTHNYLYGLPMWGLSYTVFSESKKAIESYIGIPMIDLLLSFSQGYITAHSLEAGVPSREIRLSMTDLPLSQQMTAYDNQFYKDPENIKNNFDLLVDNTFTTRISGSAVFDIAMIIVGKLNSRIWHHTEPYDIAPAFAFLKNDGLLINLYNGNQAILTDKAIIATTDISVFGQLKKIGCFGSY